MSHVVLSVSFAAAAHHRTAMEHQLKAIIRALEGDIRQQFTAGAAVKRPPPLFPDAHGTFNGFCPCDLCCTLQQLLFAHRAQHKMSNRAAPAATTAAVAAVADDDASSVTATVVRDVADLDEVPNAAHHSEAAAPTSSEAVQAWRPSAWDPPAPRSMQERDALLTRLLAQVRATEAQARKEIDQLNVTTERFQQLRSYPFTEAALLTTTIVAPAGQAVDSQFFTQLAAAAPSTRRDFAAQFLTDRAIDVILATFELRFHSADAPLPYSEPVVLDKAQWLLRRLHWHTAGSFTFQDVDWKAIRGVRVDNACSLRNTVARTDEYNPETEQFLTLFAQLMERLFTPLTVRFHFMRIPGDLGNRDIDIIFNPSMPDSNVNKQMETTDADSNANKQMETTDAEEERRIAAASAAGVAAENSDSDADMNAQVPRASTQGNAAAAEVNIRIPPSF